MTTREIVGKAVEVVTFVLAGFSGFLDKLAPPDETGASFSVGVASFTVLIVFLFVLALTQGKLRRAHRKYWYAAAASLSVVFLVAAFIYQDTRSKYTFLWPPNEDPKQLYVAGDSLTPLGQQAKSKDPSLTPAKLVSGFGGIDERESVWTADSIRRVGRKLSLQYVITVLSVAAAIFCLTEGVLVRAKPSPQATTIKKGR
jgi:hypothetical protein